MGDFQERGAKSKVGESLSEFRLLGICIYRVLRGRNYVKKKAFFGLYKKILREKTRKYYILGCRIARVTPEEVSAFGFKGSSSRGSHVFSFLGIPLASRKYASIELNDTDSKYENMIRNIHEVGSEIRDNANKNHKNVIQNIHDAGSEIKNSFNQNYIKMIQVIQDARSEIKKKSDCNLESLMQNIHDLKSEIDNYFKNFRETHYQTMWFPGKVAALHRKVFPQFRNIHSGADVVIVGCGPTLHDYVPIRGAKHISLNRAFRCERVVFDYAFIWDVAGMVKARDNVINDFSEYDCVKFCGKFLNDQIEFPAEIDCKRGKLYRCYSSARWGLSEFPVLDTVIHEDISLYPLADFMSISFAALHFALWTGARRIFLVGLDTTKNGSFDGRQNPYHFKEMFQGYGLFKKFASMHYPDTEIISVNPIGLTGVFRDVYTESYLRQNGGIQNPEILHP